MTRTITTVGSLVAAAAGAYAGYRFKRAGRESFRGKTVVITGGSRGLGFALAQTFGREGAHLALLARTPDQLAAAALRLRDEEGVPVQAVVCDIREQGEVRAAVATVTSRTGRIDVLVNNAGIISVMPFAHAQPEDFQDSLDTHFWGPYYLTRACLPYLSRHNGRIVNISSIGGRVAVPHLLPYTVGKFALVGLSEGLHAELAASGVSVTTVAPHLMQTGSHRNALVRGRHREEATWFALGTSTRLVALDAHRAARAIVRAARARKASLVLGWQARVAVLANALAPGLTGAAAAAAARRLPAATGRASGDIGRWSGDVPVGKVARFFASAAARDLNQNLAPDEG
jgi:NAD(P)-dependent dehydrogenase (short-subunit alcohol dehydrogenase family)